MLGCVIGPADQINDTTNAKQLPAGSIPVPKEFGATRWDRHLNSGDYPCRSAQKENNHQCLEQSAAFFQFSATLIQSRPKAKKQLCVKVIFAIHH